jgi:hypothetical protein
VARDGERADRALAERVAVGRGLGDRVDADGQRAAGAVVDDDGLAELLGQRGRDDARDVVGGAARRLRNDEAKGSLRKLSKTRRGGQPCRAESDNER